MTATARWDQSHIGEQQEILGNLISPPVQDAAFGEREWDPELTQTQPQPGQPGCALWLSYKPLKNSFYK